MAAINKVLKYQLNNRILQLNGQGKTTDEIAEIISDDLQERGINDSISQPTVHRYLQKVQEERAAKSSQLVQDYNEVTVPEDINILEEIKQYFLMIFRNQKKDEVSSALIPAGYDYKMRAHAAMNLHQIVYTKWQKLGNFQPHRGEGKDGEPDIPKPTISTGSRVHSILDRFTTRA